MSASDLKETPELIGDDPAFHVVKRKRAAWMPESSPGMKTTIRSFHSRPGITRELQLLSRRSLGHVVPLPRVTHQCDEAVEAVHELAVGEGEEQREHKTQMQRQQRSHRG